MAGLSAAAGHLPFAHGPQRQHGYNRRSDGGHGRADQASGSLRRGATTMALQTNEPGTDKAAGQSAEQDRNKRKGPSQRRWQRAERPVTIGFHDSSVRQPLATKGGE